VLACVYVMAGTIPVPSSSDLCLLVYIYVMAGSELVLTVLMPRESAMYVYDSDQKNRRMLMITAAVQE